LLLDCCRQLKSYDTVFDQFEIATLNNLNVETSEEALSLIPSLKQKGIPAEQIDALLADLKKYQSS